MTSSETTFNDDELIARLRSGLIGVDVDKQAADRIEQLVATNEALTEQRDKAWESLLHWRNKSFGLEEKLAVMITERDEAWKRAAHAEKMWGEALVNLKGDDK